MMDRTALYDSPLGPIALTSDGTALTQLVFLAGLANLDNLANLEQLDIFRESRRWLDCYFSGSNPGFLPPLNLKCTPFQRRVWQALLEIPYGHTTTYGALARRLGCRSAQAVGQAVGKNPVAVLVPCHRVVGSDGSLTGYAYGLEKKHFLLQLETRGLL